MSKIYVASSWKNERLDEVVKALRADGHDVYDFREHSFEWREAMAEAGFVELQRREGAPDVYAEQLKKVVLGIEDLMDVDPEGGEDEERVSYVRQFGATKKEVVDALRVGFAPPESLRLGAKEWTRVCETNVAKVGFNRDFKALREADKVVLVLPAGRSAHLEAGFAATYAEVHVYQPELERPDLMVKMLTNSGGKVWSELRDLRIAIFPGNHADRQRERAARLVEESVIGTPEERERLAARIRERENL